MDPSKNITIKYCTINNSNININQGCSSSEPPIKKIKLECFQYRLPEMTVIGREEEASELLELVKTYRRVVITGMGGLGKTSLVAHCTRNWLRIFISNAIFIDAETNETIKTTFSCLRKLPEINVQEFEDQVVQAEQIYKNFGENTTLLVFDNVTSFLTIKEYLPSKENQNFYIIITAQLREFGKTFHIYDMPLMSKENSLELMRVKLEDDWDRIKHEIEEIELLIQKMQSHPLAIIQAVSYITDKFMYEDSGYTIQKYLDEFEKSFNNIEFGDYWDDVYRYKSVYTALVMNMNMVMKEKRYGDKAETVLHCMAYLDPSAIEKDMFLYLCDSNTNILNAVIRLLRKYSLIDVESRLTYTFVEESRSEYINIHRLIQHTSQCMLKEQDERRSLLLRYTLKLLINSTHFRFSTHKQFILPHIRDFKLSDFNECYREVYRSGPSREKLTEALRRVNCEFSVVEGWTAAHYAAFEQDGEMLELLEERGQSFSLVSQQNWTVLHTICVQNFSRTYSNFFFKLNKSNLNNQTRDLNTALHILMTGNCSYDSSVTYPSCGQCGSALNLIESGCDVTLTNKDGDTAAHLAARYCHVWTLECLLEFPETDIGLTNNKKHSINLLAEESHLVIYKLTSSLSADERVRYKCIALKPLETLQAGVELLKNLVGGRRDIPDEVYYDIVQLLENIPLALKLAAGYMRQRNITPTTFKQHLNALPEDTVPSFVKNSCFGYRPNNLYVLLCDVLNYLLNEHKFTFELLSYSSYIDCPVRPSVLFDLTDGRNSMEAIYESIKILCMLCLLEIPAEEGVSEFLVDEVLCFQKLFSSRWFTLQDLFGVVIGKYMLMKGEVRAKCAAIITSENTDLRFNGKAVAVQQLGGCSGVQAVYMERYGSAPAAVQIEIDRRTANMRVLDVGDLGRWSAMHWAVYRNDQSVVAELLRLGAPIDTPADDSITPIHIAALCTSSNIFVLLLTHGRGVEQRTARDRFTPLHISACATGFSNINVLLLRDSDVNVTDNEGSTPAHLAALCGHTKTIELLRKKGAAMDKPNRAGVTPQMLLDFQKSLQ